MKSILKDRRKHHIDTYQTIIESIYSGNNKGLEFEYYYGYLDRTSGYLTKALNAKNANFTKFIRPLSWLFSLSNLFGFRLEDEFLKKYPGICPYCLETKCVCIKTNKKPLVEKYAAYQVEEELFFRYEQKRSEKEHYSLDDAVNIIGEIFYANEVIWHHTNPEHHSCRIHEEIAEIHESYCRFLNDNAFSKGIASEIADVFAWILGAWAIVYPDTSLDDRFIDYYINGCPVCKQAICTCNTYNSRPVGEVDYKQLINIKTNLESIKPKMVKHSEKINDLIKSLDVAVNNMHEPSAKLAMYHIEKWIADIKDTQVIKGDVSQVFNEITSILNEMKKC